MNHGIYRLVFNSERNSWVAVAETVRGRGKKSTRRRVAAVVLGLAALSGTADQAWAAPPPATALPVPSSGSRPFVFAGAVNGGQPSTVGNAMTITTASRLLGLNWQSFNIGSSASVTFIQPDTTSRVLNRIWSNDPSQIMGKLNANGEVYLINQNGILFGNGAQVNVGGLVASAINLSDDMAGKLLNKGLPTAKGDSLEFAYDGSVAGFTGFVTVEAGAAIRTPSGGRVVLIAPKTVENMGLIEGGGGAEAILAAGGKVILTAPDDPSLRGLLVETKAFTDKDSLGNIVSLDGTVSNQSDGVKDSNNGRISMGGLDKNGVYQGGTVSLAALAVNQKGIVNASKAINLNGTTMLVSGSTETNRLTVNQRGDVAQIDWLSGFNVGTGKTVEFVQSSPGAVAYNYVYDPDRTAADGSVLNVAGRTSIDGILKASGQFVLINEKGIDFGSNARVRASSFVASALGMNPSIVTTGLLGQTDITKRAFYLNASPSVTFKEGEGGIAQKLESVLSAFREARVKVAAGAQIESMENGYVMLLGGQVEQGGTIRAGRTSSVDAKGNPVYKGGQVLLAAGADVYLKPGFSAAIRGFTAEVNPLIALRTDRYERDALGTIVVDENGDPKYVSDNYRWIAISRGELNANRVVNTGYIEASLGDITAVGNEIDQAGTMQASTSSSMNGSIHLVARDTLNSNGDGTPTVQNLFYRKYNAQGIMASTGTSVEAGLSDSTSFIAGTDGGSLRFAAGSSTKIVIDGSDGKKLSGDQAFVKSSIEALGKQIVVDAAEIEAKGGRIQFRASETFGEMNAYAVDPATPSQGVAPAGVGVLVGDGARIDVSGTNASKSVADLFINVELRGDEFANNPVQRIGKLRGEKAWVDIRDPVSIAYLDGYLNAVGRSANELAATGGTISLGSTGSVTVRSKAKLDVSGGRVDYAESMVSESRAITASGDRYRLNDAPVSALYAGLATVTRKEAAYVEGKSAGTVELVGHDLALDGQLVAKTTVGTRQRVVGADPASNRYAVPYGGQLIVKDAGQHYPLADPNTATDAEKQEAYTKAQMVFVRGAANAVGKAEAKEAEAVAQMLLTGIKPDVEATPLELSQSLVDNGFSRFSISSDGRIDIPADISLRLPAGGSFSASGRQIYLAGDISAPSGSISLTTRDMSGATGPFPTMDDAKYSTLVVDAGASLSTAGAWVNDRLDGVSSQVAKAIDGGSVTLTSAYDLDLRAGSSVDVSGGAWVSSKGVLKAGNAGGIVLESGTGSGYGQVSTGASDSVFLNGNLSGYALGKGGALTVKTALVKIGKPVAEDQIGAGFDAGIVDRGGFFQFSFVGRSGLTVGDGVSVKPDPISWLFTNSNYLFRPTGSHLADFAASVVLHPDLRSGPTKLSFTTTDIYSGRLLVGENAYLGVSPEGSIALDAAGQLTVLGTLEAPGGKISLSRASVSNSLREKYTTGLQSESIYLGPNSKLLAGGTTVLTAATRQALEAGASIDELRAKNHYFGKVLNGGSVTLDAGLGYVITRDGSNIDVSGSEDVLNIASSTGEGVSYTAKIVGSAGGNVNIKAHAGMLLDGSLAAKGGSDALGGVFSLNFASAGNDANPWSLLIPDADDKSAQANELRAVLGERKLTLYQSATDHAELWPEGIKGNDYIAGKATLAPLSFSGKAALDLTRLKEGGFGSWYLASQNEISFAGKISATLANQLVLSAPKFSAADDTANIYLRAAAAQIGNPDIAIAAATAVATGKALATISARDIGLIGTFSWNGFASSHFVSDGEIHFDSVVNGIQQSTGRRAQNGQLSAAGAVEFAAARLSPATYSDFRVDLLSDPNGSILISRPADSVADVSLSPAGRLEFAAPTIKQDGTVTAPLGQIIFSAPAQGGSITLTEGSVTSVAADRDLLFGQTTQSGTDWVYNGTKVETLPAKSIVIDGGKTTVASGATLNLSGGGDAKAWEFTAGPGGKKDVLATTTGTYAIVPGWAGFSATDSELQSGYLIDATGAVPSLKAGDQIALGSNPYGLNGSYVLLPARYAVLPGAYLVTLKTGNDATLGGALRQADGSWLVSGQRLAVNENGTLTSYAAGSLTVELATSSVVASRAKYVMSSANQFFYDQKGANLPGDAGLLTAVGRESLAFDPVVVAMRAAEISAEDGRKRAGRGLEIDLAAPRLMVSDGAVAPDASWSLIDQNKLNALGASSVLLGGVRTIDGDTTRIETVASLLQVANTKSVLTGSELMLTARDQVLVKAGSRIESKGEANARQIVLSTWRDENNVLRSDGAFVRVAEGAQATLHRDAGDIPATTGKFLLEKNAVDNSVAVVAGQALYFDATKDNLLNGKVVLGKLQSDGSRGTGGSVAIGAGRINVVGDNGGVPTDGLTLSNADLERFASADQIRLASYTTFDLYGNATLGTSSLKELIVSAFGIAGYGSEDASSKISANKVVFENQNLAKAEFAAPKTLGKGSLQVSAQTVEFGDNATTSMRRAETTGFAIGGFDKVNITATGDLRFAGKGVTSIDNAAASGNKTALNIDAGRVVTVGTADHLLIASGKTTITGGKGASTDTGLGGSLELRASALDVSGRIETPAGKLSLRATGSEGVTLKNGAVLIAEGRKVAFDDTYAYAPGGDIALVADTGNVTVNEGAKVSVSADPSGGDAGSLTMTAKSGTVSAGKASLFGSAGSDAAQGSLLVDAKQLDMDALADAVYDGKTRQFAGSWDIRQREGSLSLSKRIVAADVSIATDKGGIDIVSGAEIDASGAKGGRIALYSRDGDINLHGNLIAQGQAFVENTNNAGTRGQGGTVILGASGTGKVSTASGSSIDVGVAKRLVDGVVQYSAAKGGKVIFRATSPNFTSSKWQDNLNIVLAGSVVGASDVGAEFYYTETGTSLKTGNSDPATKTVGFDGTGSSIKKTLSTNFSDANMETLAKQLGFTNSTIQHVRPGVEIDTPSGSVSDFTVGSDLAFGTLRFGNTAEAGVLTIRASGDLKVNGTLSDGFASVARNAALNSSGQSWSYRLVSGADQAAADPMASVAPPTGIGADGLNGKGSLEVAAGKLIRTGTGDILLAARRNIKLNKNSAIYTAGLADSSTLADFKNVAQSNLRGLPQQFALDGGDVSLTAGEGVEMASSTASGRHINEWLYRIDNTLNNTQWWSQIPSFQEGVATFGGGDIAVLAGTTIKNLTVATPTSGRVPRDGIDNGEKNGNDQPDKAVILGGGDLTIRAGGAVDGGLYYAETGKLRIKAGSMINKVGLALGDTDARVVTTGDLQLGNVFNPLSVKSLPVQSNGSSESSSILKTTARIGTYGDNTALNLTTVAGSASLSPSGTFYGVSDTEAGALMPSRVKVAALTGSIGITGDLVQSPGTSGQLDLLASDGISLGGAIIQLDVPSSLLPSLRNPMMDVGSNGRSKFVLTSLAREGATREAHADTLWHADDYEASRLIALSGDITANNAANHNGASQFNEAVHIEAGGNVTNFPVEIQNTHASDVSKVVAGGGIKFENKTESGEVTGPARGIRVAGPGGVEIIAGKSIDLGDSEGIVTVGNLDNPYLPSGGADIFALAGGQVNYAALRHYFGVGQEVGEADLRTRFYEALRDFGKLAQSTGDNSNYEKGRSLIALVFPPEMVGKGDILLSVSQIKTEQGGNMQMMAPGGSIVVGVLNPSLTKKASQQGIFSINGGDVFAFVEKNYLVNQSRTFTLNGGDIMIWSNHGDIDAGSGSKTAVSTPPPVLVVRDGQLVLDTSNSVSGSGIGALASRDDTPASDMSLFAPDGTIDAGDAGLRSTGNITLGARTILNASNIQAGGSVAGAPAATAAAAPVAAMASPTSKEDRMLEESPSAAGKRNGGQGMLTVEVLGGDDCNDSTRNRAAGEKNCNPG